MVILILSCLEAICTPVKADSKLTDLELFKPTRLFTRVMFFSWTSIVGGCQVLERGDVDLLGLQILF